MKRDAMESIITDLTYKTHIRIHTMYNIKVPPQWSIHKRRNEDHHIIYVKGGIGWYNVEGERIPLEAGRLIYVSNGCLHSSGADPNNLPSIMPIRFGIYNHHTMEPIKGSKPYYMTLMENPGGAFLEKFQSIHEYYSNIEQLGYSQICHSLLTHVLIDCYHQVQKGRMGDGLGISIKRYIDQHIHHKLKLEELADAFGLSTKHISRIFKKHYGITPKQYLITQLIAQGNYYMDNTSLAIYEIALRLGYPDLYTFSKQYKKVMGYSPMGRKRQTLS